MIEQEPTLLYKIIRTVIAAVTINSVFAAYLIYINLRKIKKTKKH